MDIVVDGKLFLLDLVKVSNHLKSWYNANKNSADTVLLENGKKVDFSRKSLARIGFKTLMTPILIPMVHQLYRYKKLDPPKKEKHEDLIDYTAMALFGFVGELDKDKLYVETVESSDRDCRRISSIATYEPVSSSTTGQGDITLEDTQVSTRGEACIYSGEIGDGKDVSDKSSHKEETGNTTVVERVPCGLEETG